MTKKEMEKITGVKWRVNLSIVLGIAWLAFDILWLTFYAGAYNIYQNIAILFVSLIICSGIIGGAWSMSDTFNSVWDPDCCGAEEDIAKFPRQRWGTILAIITGTGWLVFLALWLGFYAGAYTHYQNISIFWGSLVVIAMGIWMMWVLANRQIEDGNALTMMRTRTIYQKIDRSNLLGVTWLIFLTAWFWFYAELFNSYQNLAIFLVSLLLCGAAISVTWVSGSSQSQYS